MMNFISIKKKKRPERSKIKARETSLENYSNNLDESQGEKGKNSRALMRDWTKIVVVGIEEDTDFNIFRGKNN